MIAAGLRLVEVLGEMAFNEREEAVGDGGRLQEFGAVFGTALGDVEGVGISLETGMIFSGMTEEAVETAVAAEGDMASTCLTISSMTVEFPCQTMGSL